jgi:Zn-dependent protease with chaperone function/phage FluMu protein Com
MPLTIECQSCRARLQVSEAHAGKRGKCPKCAAVLQIPASSTEVSNGQPHTAKSARVASAAPPQPAASRSVASPLVHSQRSASNGQHRQPAAGSPGATADPVTAQLLAGFRGAMKPARPSLLYLVSAVLVSGTIVLLPLVYLLLVVAVGVATAGHAVYSSQVFSSMPIRFAIVVYLAPLFAGATLLVFMLKPLLARPAHVERSRSLTRVAEPRLFAFVEKICQTVGAPMPTRIDIDADVNASASLRRGVLSLFSDDLVLTVGVPLVACLDVNQFAGVLAHEFGHFTQRGAMRLGYLVHKVNGWFVRLVYERDSWDESLTSLADDTPLAVQMACGLAAMCIGITRGILWMFMVLSVFLSRVLLRQQEFHADLHEIRLSGSQVFVETTQQIHLALAAQQAVMADLIERLPSGSLPDSFPRMMQRLVADPPPKMLKSILRSIDTEKPHLLATHPTSKERIERANRVADPGIFSVELPATVLLSNFRESAKNVTLDVYRGIFGPQFNRECLVDTDPQHLQTAQP